MSNLLLDPDPGFQDLDNDELRATVGREGESVLRRGRALTELGRRASSDETLLTQVADMIRAPENRELITVGTASISQLGTAGLVAGRSEQAFVLAVELAGEWQRGEQSDFARLMRSSGIAWRGKAEHECLAAGDNSSRRRPLQVGLALPGRSRLS